LKPVPLGPKIDGARSATSEHGVVVMDRAARSGQLFHARLRIGDAECTLLYASDDDLLSMSWHGWIDVAGEQRRVSIHPVTWVLTFHEAMQRLPTQGEAA
jgi:hypothetical protein